MVTGRELWDGVDDEGREYDEVSSRLTGTWRWGTCYESVYQRVGDLTHWMMRYRTQTEEGILWDSVEVSQVEPVEEKITVTRWKPVEGNQT